MSDESIESHESILFDLISAFPKRLKSKSQSMVLERRYCLDFSLSTFKLTHSAWFSNTVTSSMIHKKRLKHGFIMFQFRCSIP